MRPAGNAEDASIMTRRIDDRVCVLDATGDLDVHSASNLKAAIDACIGDQMHHLVVNLSGVSFIDSSGLGVFVRAFKTLQEVGGSLAVINPNPQVVKLLSITNLASVIPSYADEASALKAVT